MDMSEMDALLRGDDTAGAGPCAASDLDACAPGSSGNDDEGQAGLYDDLEGSHVVSLHDTFHQQHIEELHGDLRKKKADMESLQTSLRIEQDKAERLLAERSVLLRNISVLYRTAVAEIERKNNDIKDLRAQLAAASMSAGPLQQGAVPQRPPLPPPVPPSPPFPAAPPSGPPGPLSSQGSRSGDAGQHQVLPGDRRQDGRQGLWQGALGQRHHAHGRTDGQVHFWDAQRVEERLHSGTHLPSLAGASTSGAGPPVTAKRGRSGSLDWQAGGWSKPDQPGVQSDRRDQSFHWGEQHRSGRSDRQSSRSPPRKSSIRRY